MLLFGDPPFRASDSSDQPEQDAPSLAQHQAALRNIQNQAGKVCFPETPKTWYITRGVPEYDTPPHDFQHEERIRRYWSGPKFWNTPKRNSVEDLACFDYWTLLTGRKTDKHNKRAGRVPIAWWNIRTAAYAVIDERVPMWESCLFMHSRESLRMSVIYRKSFSKYCSTSTGILKYGLVSGCSKAWSGRLTK
jgi:hypothetical protein